MRQRKIKNVEEKLAELKAFFVEDAQMKRGLWKQEFGNQNEIYFELGCGKGQFIIAQAQAHPHRNYIGVEGQLSVVFRALQKLEQTTISSIRFACAFVNLPELFFAEGELAGIYLNFSDPWPKARHAKKRLTHRNYLLQYHKILKAGGFVEMKTDNEDLFFFTEQEAMGLQSGLFRIAASTKDLHHSQFEAKNITTEYEEKFKGEGRQICYLRLERLG